MKYYLKIKTRPVGWIAWADTEWESNIDPRDLSTMDDLQHALDTYNYIIDREKRLWDECITSDGRYVLVQLKHGSTIIKEWRKIRW